MASTIRRRTNAIIDKKTSFLNYINSEDKSDVFTKRLSKVGYNDSEIEKLRIQAIRENEFSKNKIENALPDVPKLSGVIKKDYENPKFSTKSYVVENFDMVDEIESQFSLISFQDFTSELSSEDIKNMKSSDLLSIDFNDYDKAYKKIDEMKRIAKSINDTDLTEFFRSKKRAIENEKEKIKVVQNNFDKIDEYMLFDDSVKYFFSKS